MPESDIQQLRANATAAGPSIKALANPDRLMLLCPLSMGDRNASYPKLLPGTRRPTRAQRLAVLRREGTHGAGKQASYRVRRAAALAVIQTAYRFCAGEAS